MATTPDRKTDAGRRRGWAVAFALPVAVMLFTPADWPAWALMWLLAAAIFAGCKWLSWRDTQAPDVPWWQHLGYLFGWPGLDARAFLQPASAGNGPRPECREWCFAGTKCAFGAVIFWGLAPCVSSANELLLGWVGMVGLIFLLHFGCFHLLSCFWRSIGVDARPLMDWPLRSTSVSEFWGRRWNTAFRDFTLRFLFRPLAGKVGLPGAILGGFLFSGLVHDLVISLPAGAGYGLPTAFFAFQGLAVLGERSAMGKTLGLTKGWRGRAFTLLAVAAPAWLLFHPPFVRQVVLPFMAVLGVTGRG